MYMKYRRSQFINQSWCDFVQLMLEVQALNCVCSYVLCAVRLGSKYTMRFVYLIDIVCTNFSLFLFEMQPCTVSSIAKPRIFEYF